jgi:GH15 family glucan-1,4-alpha-glucosidase
LGVDVSLPIEDYGLIGDTHTAALVGRDGSIDWLCLPRFDSGACFAALLGTPTNGRWHVGPSGPVRAASRRYRTDTLVLETDFDTADGLVRVVDCMLPRDDVPTVIRIVQGIRGKVDMTMELIIRFDYGSVVPWVRKIDGRLHAIGGPDALTLDTPIETYGRDLTTRAEFTVAADQSVPFVLTWHPSHLPSPPVVDASTALEQTEKWWRDWASHCQYEGRWRDQVVRSSVVLKALTYAPTGGMVAAATTSLPEQLRGVRNWDYRYCWLRDATYTLYALMIGGYTGEAAAWRDWLLRAVAGDPATMQTMYSVNGERRLTELEIPWLEGYEHSRPVRIGNAAVEQLQLDVYGELIDAMHVARRCGIPSDEHAWALESALLHHLETAWREPDHGIWEVRGPRRHFTHSKVMAWVAFDRAVKAVERFGLPGPVERWRELRDEVHDQVCREGFNTTRQTFTQFFGSADVDASLLLIPLVGFLPAEDPRMAGTVTAVERDLLHNGFVRRYCTREDVDGLPAGEGAFVACTFWLADNYQLQGRHDEAVEVFERLVRLSNDLGLMSEEYDTVGRRLLGNFPQAFSHVMLINTARNLARSHGPAERRHD